MSRVLGLGILKTHEVGEVKLRLMLAILLCLSGIAFASGQQENNGRPKIQLEHPNNPHLDIPKNCQSIVEPDDSVALICECEACGTVADEEAELQKRQDPDQWVCKTHDGGLYCAYDLDTQTSRERWHSRI